MASASFAAIASATPVRHLSPTKMRALQINPRTCFLSFLPTRPLSVSHLSTLAPDVSLQWNERIDIHLSPKAATSLTGECTEEPETKVEFQVSLTPPGCSSALSLLGTGYREKVFAIIGVKVYAAGFYANPSIFSKLDAWKGRSAAEVQQDSALFNAILHDPAEKLLQIVLVRDLDGKTFWDALDEAVSPRIALPNPVDESALSTFRSIFQGRPLKKGTSIFLTWLESTKMNVCVSSDKQPCSIDATIESLNVTSALFDVFLGDNPVSPSLKASASKGLAVALK